MNHQQGFVCISFFIEVLLLLNPNFLSTTIGAKCEDNTGVKGTWECLCSDFKSDTSLQNSDRDNMSELNCPTCCPSRLP